MSLTASLQSLPLGHAPQLSSIIIGVLLMLGVFMAGKGFENN